MLRKPHFTILVVVAVVALLLFALPERARSRVRVAFGTLFLPLFGLAGSVQALSDRSAGALTPRTVLADRLRALDLECQRLRLERVQAEAMARDNERLRQMVGFAQRTPWRLRPARVIGRDPANWWQTIHLDVGSREGITTNLAVLSPEGLVGRVAEVGPRTTRVVLIGDPNCPVSAALAESRETGIIRGTAGGELLRGSLVVLSYLPPNAVVRPGQRVLTSGQGGVFPAGIPIGEVVDVRAVEAGVFLEARVRLAVNLGAIDMVWVKLP